MSAIDGLSGEIAAVAKGLPAAAADDYIESELTKFAVQMRQYEEMGRTPATSIGQEIDAWLRKRITAALTR